MKITAIQTLCLSRPHEPERQWFTASYRTLKADCAIVIIDTDEGLRGIGEACAYGVPPKIREEVARLTPTLLGRDPLDPTVNPRPVGRNAPFDTATAGIDAALWDLRGKVADQRVAELLAAPGQTPLPRVRLYASSGCRYDWENRPESIIDEALGYAEEGYTAYKMRTGTEWSWAGVTVERFLDLMRQVVGAVGDRMEVMLDGNQRLCFDDALVVARELDALGCAWLEEPIPQADIAGYARLNEAVAMPVTGGEQFTTVEQFEPYFAQRAYAIVQADGGWCGLTEGMRIARRAYEFGVGMCPHNWHNGLMTLANAHLVAALPEPKVLELCLIQGPLQWEILREKPVIRDGYLELPAAPGLGVELAEDLEERFPYIEGPYGVRVER
jgi:L-alanine-DL-glutamate epimerase-like enolase superfamily enzyme